MSGELTDVYAVVDKSKKIRNKGESSPSHKLHQNLSDAHAVVDKNKQPEKDDMGKVLTAQQEIPTIEDGTQYAITPIYQELEVNNSQSSPTPHIYEKVHSCYKNKTHRAIQKPGCRYSIFIVSYHIFLVTAVIAAIVAALVTISLTVNLQNNLKNVKQRHDQLETDSHSNKRQQENTSLGFGEAISLLRANMQAINYTFIQQVSSVANAITESITTANNFQASINTLTDVLAKGIQAIHIFDYCADVFNFSIQLPSGVYSIRSGNSSINKYCSATTITTIANSCNGIPGRWKRIAYLNTDENPVTCPDGFEVRNDTFSPPLCRRMDTSAGCSSVIYPSYGMSYSQVCGTVRVHPEGTPDGFSSHSSNQRLSNGQSVNQNYVDGVSLTYGDSSNRNHIWTYTAAITVRFDRIGCDICNNSKSIIPGTNFTCTNGYCSSENSCFPYTLWGNDTKQCFGNETFYRQLTESITDNIEMRVCRDESRSNEDILLSFVELFVL